ncbi:hypothetical protein EGW08_012720 [Elysia chlorotica]|uniref:Uncharacterized protein n=1 Tax=Elysia chlorotica TaxID=188477 RepID=A0A433TD50_ELYCH|nr:hypothetical protein EGW08_012720 [Elysia chlorotica]
MVYQGIPLNPEHPTESLSSGMTILQSQPENMELVEQHTPLMVGTAEPVGDGYHYTEKCLNWQNNCSNTEVYHILNDQSIILTATSTVMDNMNMKSTTQSVDNAHCFSNYQHGLSEQFLPDQDGSEYASDFSLQDKLDQNSHCSVLPAESCHRIRRDSEESEESMDTSSSLASSPYAFSVGSKCTETLSIIDSADKIITQSEERQNLNEICQNYTNDSCAISLDGDLEKTTPEPSINTDLVIEPFFSHVKGTDTDFAKNPPVVTNNLIVVKDESFLYQSQISLEQHPYDVPQANFIFRASTLPDLRAYQRHQEEYGLPWGFQDARIFLSENGLSRSMCLSHTESLIFNYDIEYDGLPDGQRYRPKQLVDIEGNPIKIVPSSDHTTVMILLSLCVSILFVATDVIRNLQTSLHPKDGLGLTSLALIFAGYTLGSLISTPLIQHIQPRACLIMSIIPNILFLLANLSSTLWLLAPISFLQGTSMAVTWSVLSTYIAYLAKGRALGKEENIKVVCTKFFNYFSLIYQGLLLFGNLASSMLLKYGDRMHSMNSSLFSSTSSSEMVTDDAKISPFPFISEMFILVNKSLPTSDNISSASDFERDSLSDVGLCGASYHNQDHIIDGGDPWLHPHDGTIYMLHGTFIGCTLVSLGIAVFGIEPLNMDLFTLSGGQPSRHMRSLCTSVKRSFKGMIYGCMALKFVLLLPLFMYSVIQFGFITAEVTAAFITCPVGINQIGFSMALFTVGRFPTSFFCGVLTKKCGRLPLITFAATINLISLIILAQWRPVTGDVCLIHTVMFFWGLSDGIWISQVNGLISSIFKLHLEATLGGMRVAQGLGVTIFLSMSRFVDMKIKVFIMMASCSLALVGYLVMRISLYCENRHSQQQQRRAFYIHRGSCKEEV